jgi:precorrin-2 dehydrogenase/sirohydrochlorin ferrochelatase
MYLMIPLFVDLSGKAVVIFGGGDVAARKAALFLREARVTVVSRSFSPAFDSLPVERVRREIGVAGTSGIKRLIQGAFLVIAALPDPAINDGIGGVCRATGVLFNNADGSPGDVVIPSVIAGDHYAIGISTQGMSPAVSRYLRELIEAQCPALDAMIELQNRTRSALRGRVPSQERRSAILVEILNDRSVWEALVSGGDEAWRIVERRYLGG